MGTGGTLPVSSPASLASAQLTRLKGASSCSREPDPEENLPTVRRGILFLAHCTQYFKEQEFTLRQFHSFKTSISTMNIVGQASRPISTSKLKALQPVHIWPINHVIYMESLVRINRKGNLISGGAWHLDAFSAYPFST